MKGKSSPRDSRWTVAVLLALAPPLLMPSTGAETIQPQWEIAPHTGFYLTHQDVRWEGTLANSQPGAGNEEAWFAVGLSVPPSNQTRPGNGSSPQQYPRIEFAYRYESKRFHTESPEAPNASTLRLDEHVLTQIPIAVEFNRVLEFNDRNRDGYPDPEEIVTEHELGNQRYDTKLYAVGTDGKRSVLGAHTAGQARMDLQYDASDTRALVAEASIETGALRVKIEVKQNLETDIQSRDRVGAQFRVVVEPLKEGPQRMVVFYANSLAQSPDASHTVERSENGSWQIDERAYGGVRPFVRWEGSGGKESMPEESTGFVINPSDDWRGLIGIESADSKPASSVESVARTGVLPGVPDTATIGLAVAGAWIAGLALLVWSRTMERSP